MRDLVLVVDDNADVRAFVRLSLESQDFRIIEAVNALEAMLKLASEKPNLIILTGSDKILLGQICSEIIGFRPPEPYKGKGVKISGSLILRKEGKKK